MAKPPIELDTLIGETIKALGFDYWGAEFFTQQQGPLLRVYLERLDGHINIDECASVSRQLNAVFAVESNLPESYTLEVSSPGLERPLFNAQQFAQFVGKTAKVRIFHAVDGQRNFVGDIAAADEQTLTLNIEGQTQGFAMSEIDKARLVVAFET